MPYSIEEHKHRYSAWAASRAASTITSRFSVLQGKRIIENIGLNQLIARPELLPSPKTINAIHRRWREDAIRAAVDEGLEGFSHGVAAKLINVYFKGTFVCAGHDQHVNVAALHPPIDSVLLNALYKENVGELRDDWAIARGIRWSKLNSDQYEHLIANITNVMGNRPLWEIEEFWRGHQ